MSTQPTDAEILELASQYWYSLDETESETEIELVRAALAKWGQPAQAAEPVAWRVHPFDYGIGHEGVYAITMREEQREAWRRKGWNTEPLFTAPQPVARESLSDEEVASLCKVGPVYAPDGKVTRTPSQYRDELEAAQRYGLRKGERAHGIKGGQHGTDT